MKLAVIDPGVFAAGVFWRHEPHLCLKAWLHGLLTPVVSEDILAEYEAVLEQVAQEHRFTTDTEIWLDALRESALWVEWNPKGKTVCPEFRDQILIDAALTAKCQTIIALDRNLTELEKPFGIDIHTPREWLETLTPSQRRRLR
ncbi:MAG TPA: putative toxin-antitoxin system toxin component, PIN family [Verrucomicrobiae bacterium]|nr:putative toxin-antitoxin system toxin component, PIN family [Verrucomicrobiae bacterium]